MFEIGREYEQLASSELKCNNGSVWFEAIARGAAVSNPLLPHLDLLSASPARFTTEPGTAFGAQPVSPESNQCTTHGAGDPSPADLVRHSPAKKKHQFEAPRYLSPGTAAVEEKPRECSPQATGAGRAGETRSILVSEIAFAFMLSLAGASRRRPDMEPKITDHDDEEGTTPRDPGRLHLSANERHAPALHDWPTADKFSWTKAIRPLAATDNGIAFDAGSLLVDQTSVLAKADLQSRLAAASVASWWKSQTGEHGSGGGSDHIQYSNAIAPVDANANNRTRAKMIVGLTDTLAEVARELFHDESLAWLIADLNKGAIKEHTINGKRIVRLKHRQEIVLPNWLDVVEFNYARSELSRSIKVVTLIEKTRVDIDLIKLGLTNVVGCAENSTT